MRCNKLDHAPTGGLFQCGDSSRGRGEGTKANPPSKVNYGDDDQKSLSDKMERNFFSISLIVG